MGEVNQLELTFSKMVKYVSLDPKWYKKSDFEPLCKVVKIDQVKI